MRRADINEKCDENQERIPEQSEEAKDERKTLADRRGDLGLVILTRISSSFAMQASVSVAGIALMTAVATLLTWEAKRDCRGPKLF